MNTTLIEQIVNASRSPLPSFEQRYVTRYVAGHAKAGQVCNSIGWGEKASVAERAEAYFVAFDYHQGVTYGPRFNSQEEATAHYQALSDKSAALFRSELEKMNGAQLQAQADYWLNLKAA
jgi:hypothetical protein